MIFRSSRRSYCRIRSCTMRPTNNYPKSLWDFYDKNIDNQPTLQNDMLLAVDTLYKVAGAGSSFDYDK